MLLICFVVLIHIRMQGFPDGNAKDCLLIVLYFADVYNNNNNNNKHYSGHIRSNITHN